MRVRSKVPLALAIAGTVALAACGSSSSSSSGTTGAGAGPKLTGAPVKIMVITALSGPSTTITELGPAVQAAADAINKAGGIKGGPVQVTVCDDQFNPNKGAACAAQAVAGKYLAVTADSSTGDNYMPILTKAKIPVIGEVPNSASELFSANSFPFGSGVVQIAGGGTACGKLGKTKTAVAVVDIAAGRNSAAFFGIGLKPYGLTNTKTVAIPPTATDMTTYAANLTGGGTNCIELVLAGSQAVQLIQALSQAGYSGVTTYGDTLVGSKLISDLGSQGGDLILVGATPPVTDPTNAGVKQYNAELDAAGVAKDTRDEGSMTSWAALHVVANTAANLATVDGPSLMAALTKAGPISFAPLPTVDFAKPVPLIAPTNRIFTTNVFLSEVKDGKRSPLFNNQSFNVLAAN